MSKGKGSRDDVRRLLAHKLIWKANQKNKTKKDIFKLIENHPDMLDPVTHKKPTRSTIYRWIDEAEQQEVDIVDKDRLSKISDHPLEDHRKAAIGRHQAAIQRLDARRKELLQEIDDEQSKDDPNKDTIKQLYSDLDFLEKSQREWEKNLAQLNGTWATPLEQMLAEEQARERFVKALINNVDSFSYIQQGEMFLALRDAQEKARQRMEKNKKPVIDPFEDENG